MKSTRKSLIKKLDKVFSEYIRRRTADQKGYVECFTCGKKDHWKKMQCGHFQSRKHYSTRWNEDNCQVQCVGCNMFKSGEQYKFGLKLNMISPNTAENLFLLARNTKKFNNFDLELMIQKYQKFNLQLPYS
tara:strand:+ start:1544 stop:1936 length:393 start_codon:yes stop_codon:yes gene_type:complete